MRARNGLVVASVLLIAGVSAFVVVRGVGGVRAQSYLVRTIQPLELMDISDADDAFVAQLEEAAAYARRRPEWVRLLRLAWQLNMEYRYPVVERIAARAVRMFPRDELFSATAAYAAVQNGAPDRGEQYLSHEPPVGETAFLVRVLTSTDLEPLENLPESAGAAFALVQMVRRGNADAYARAFEATGAHAAALDGALVALGEGDRAGASSLAASMRPQTETERVGGLFVYRYLDLDERFDALLRSLQPETAVDPRVLLLQADRWVASEQWARARAVYEEMIAVHPTYSAIPFVNLSYDSFHRGNIEAAVAIADRGVRMHSADVGALLNAGLLGLPLPSGTALISDAEAANQGSQIIYARDRDLQHEVRLLYHLNAPDRGNIARFEADLWTYVNRYPDAERVAAFLARHLYRRGDRSGLHVLLQRASDQAGWAFTVRAVDAVREGRLEQAEQLFAQALEHNGGWRDHYNAILFALKHLPPGIAEQRLRAAQRYAERVALSTEARVAFLLLEAEIARLRDQPGAVRQAVARALTIDPQSVSLRAYAALIAP